jgi:hypothetical protein
LGREFADFSLLKVDEDDFAVVDCFSEVDAGLFGVDHPFHRFVFHEVFQASDRGLHLPIR